MPPRKQKPSARAVPAPATNAADDADLDALLDAAIQENQGVAGSPAALRLEQEQREAREKVEAEVGAALSICGGCGAGQAKMKCSGCATVRYCSERCQVAHWPAHKARCRVLKAAVAAAEAEYEALQRGEGEEQEVTFNPDTERGNCWTCGADNPHHVCNRCKVTKYCGVACQTENWPIHKGRCAFLKEHAAGLDEVKDDLKKIKAGVWQSQEDFNVDLCNACLLGRIVDIERIIAAGGMVGAVSHDNCRPLDKAAQEGHFRAIGVLVRHGAQVNAIGEKGATAMHRATQNGQVKAVAALVEHGAQVDTRCNQGASCLHWASEQNFPEVVALLLQHGAQVDLATNEGVTPLLISAKKGHAAVVRLKLEHGAQIDLKNNAGVSPLHYASQNNHPEVVALLLEYGAQVDLPNAEGITALFVSAYNDHVDCVRLLLQAGADPLYRDKIGFTPIDVATANDHPEVVALLQARLVPPPS